jgi:hypothetical protein
LAQQPVQAAAMVRTFLLGVLALAWPAGVAVQSVRQARRSPCGWPVSMHLQHGNGDSRKPPPAEKRRTLKLRGGPGANPTLTLHQSPARGHPSRCTQRRCECFITVNAMAWRECHPATAESDTPVLFPALYLPGLHNPGLDHNREGQAPSISSPKRDPYCFPVRPRTGHT